MADRKKVSDETIAEKDQKSKTQAIPVVDELDGWVTPGKAADMLGLKVASMSAKIHDHKVDCIKIGGIILIAKASVEKFAEERKAMGLDVEYRTNLAKLASILSPDEVKALLESHQIPK
jgi:hypothetical protein